MNKKICLITGATDGIGKATAKQLAARGHKVVAVARNLRKVTALMQEINSANDGPRPDFLIADLSSVHQVNDMLRTFKERYDRLDILINNAGIIMPKARLTEDGIETTFQVNYLAPFIITNSLLDHLKRSEAGRIINVTSSVYSLGKFALDNIHSTESYSAITTYSTSKLYLLLFTKELSTRINGGITVNSMHPGIVKTNMSTLVQGFPTLFKIISALALPFAITPEKAAQTPVFLATSDSVRTITGKYFVNSKPVKTKSKFDTPANRQQLWDTSMKIWETNTR